MPLTWMCKKQGCVSHSSTEAEVVALEMAVRMEVLTGLQLWDSVINVYDGKRVKELWRSLIHIERFRRIKPCRTS